MIIIMAFEMLTFITLSDSLVKLHSLAAVIWNWVMLTNKLGLESVAKAYI